MTEPGAGLAPVTVVVGCFNHAQYVEQALTAVFDQDHADIRVIVTDDASSDDTQATVRRLLDESGWEAELVFHETNVGICRTFNEALARVQTPYVAFISADDWMLPGRLSSQVALLESQPEAALAYGDAELVGPDGERLGRRYSSLFEDGTKSSGGWPGGDHADLFARLIRLNWLPAPTVLSRTEALRAEGGYNEALPFEDFDMWLRLSLRHAFAYDPRPVACYRIHPEQMSVVDHLNTDVKLLRINLTLYPPYLGIDPRIDAWLTGKLFEWSCQAYVRGLPAREVAPHLRRYARRHPRPGPMLYAAASTLGLPGRLLARGSA